MSRTYRRNDNYDWWQIEPVSLRRLQRRKGRYRVEMVLAETFRKQGEFERTQALYGYNYLRQINHYQDNGGPVYDVDRDMVKWRANKLDRADERQQLGKIERLEDFDDFEYKMDGTFRARNSIALWYW